MKAQVKFVDYSGEMLHQLKSNVSALMIAWGQESVGSIVDNMEKGYGKPIRDTGNLMRDVQYVPENSKPQSVDVGNTLPYSLFIHEVTRRIKTARHYIRDALLGGSFKKRLLDLAVKILPQNMK